MNVRWILLAAITAALAGVGVARATVHGSTPIGPLPKGPVSKIEASPGSLVAVALPRQNPSTGLVWRVARPVDPRVLRQRDEADVGSSVVLVFRVVGRGTATVRFGLTRGDSSPKAVKSATYVISAR